MRLLLNRPAAKQFGGFTSIAGIPYGELSGSYASLGDVEEEFTEEVEDAFDEEVRISTDESRADDILEEGEDLHPERIEEEL